MWRDDLHAAAYCDRHMAEVDRNAIFVTSREHQVPGAQVGDRDGRASEDLLLRRPRKADPRLVERPLDQTRAVETDASSLTAPDVRDAELRHRRGDDGVR